MYKRQIKFRIINREENGGLSAARNTGILEAKGDYLLSLIHISDMLRTCLLLQYGGYWLDATCLLTSSFPEVIDKSEYFMFQRHLFPCLLYTSRLPMVEYRRE